MGLAPAIETLYAGHLFRSRTEARWAVFFDAAGIPWQYEAEGYEIPSGRYLPDFLLPRESVHIEVKGVLPTPEPCDAPFDMDPVYRSLLELPSATNKPAFLLVGAPGSWGHAGDPPPIWGVSGVPLNHPERWGFMCGFAWGECSACGVVAIRHPDNDTLCCEGRPMLERGAKVLAAFVAARSARFEHDAKWRP